jgi:hypothetical protein
MLLLTALGVPLLGADFCAVRVTVTDEHGKSIPAPVELFDSDGHLVQRVYAKTGEAEFCDFEFGLYMIKAGESRCHDVTVHNIGLQFGRNQHFWIVLPDCPLAIDGFRYPSGCDVYLRIVGDNGLKVSEAEVMILNGSKRTSSDSFGRVMILIPTGILSKIVVRAPGYADTHLDLNCKGQESIKLPVKLDRQ